MTLNIGFNNIGDKGANGLVQGLKELKNLQTMKLDIQYNNIGDEGAKGLGQGLKE